MSAAKIFAINQKLTEFYHIAILLLNISLTFSYIMIYEFFKQNLNILMETSPFSLSFFSVFEQDIGLYLK